MKRTQKHGREHRARPRRTKVTAKRNGSDRRTLYLALSTAVRLARSLGAAVWVNWRAQRLRIEVTTPRSGDVVLVVKSGEWALGTYVEKDGERLLSAEWGSGLSTPCLHVRAHEVRAVVTERRPRWSGVADTLGAKP